MEKIKFIKAVLGRHACIGLSIMGIYNLALLFLYFTHRIDAIPVNLHLLKVDAFLVFGVTVLGSAAESAIRAVRKGSGQDSASGRGQE